MLRGYWAAPQMMGISSIGLKVPNNVKRIWGNTTNVREHQ